MFWGTPMDTILYNRVGKPVALLVNNEDENVISLWNGMAVGYLYEDQIYGWNGKQLGWYIDGVIYDMRGFRVGFTRHRCPVVVTRAPAKPKQLIKGTKKLRDLPGKKPELTKKMSLMELEFLLESGRSQQA